MDITKYLFFVVALVGVTSMDITIYSRVRWSYIDGHKGKIHIVIFPLYPKITVLYYFILFHYYGIFTNEVQLQVD